MAAHRQPSVRPVADRRYFSRGAGVRTSHLFGPHDGANEGICGTTELDIGGAVPLHSHNCEETVMILEGEALFEAAGQRHALVAGDTTWTPAGVDHRFSNCGDGRLRILWFYGRSDATRTVAATGATSPIADEGSRVPAPALPDDPT